MSPIYLLLLLAALALVGFLLHATGVLRPKGRRSMPPSKAVSPANRPSTIHRKADAPPIDYPQASGKNK